MFVENSPQNSKSVKLRKEDVTYIIKNNGDKDYIVANKKTDSTISYSFEDKQWRTFHWTYSQILNAILYDSFWCNAEIYSYEQIKQILSVVEPDLKLLEKLDKLKK